MYGMYLNVITYQDCDLRAVTVHIWQFRLLLLYYYERNNKLRDRAVLSENKEYSL